MARNSDNPNNPDNPTKNTPKITLTIFAYGILEQGGGFENYLLKTSSDLARLYPHVAITIVTMSPAKVERLQHVLSLYFMSKQDPKAIYRETTAFVKQKLGKRVRYIHANNTA